MRIQIYQIFRLWTFIQYELHTGISSSNLYWTLTNPYVSKFRYDCAIRLDTLLPHKYTGYDDRSSLIALSSASKYLVSKTGGLVPYGFTYESEMMIM